MKSRFSDDERLKRAFREAYDDREWVEAGDPWRAQVMERIRKIGQLNTAGRFWSDFEHLVWRLAPVCCLLILALAVLFLNMDFDSGNDLLGPFTAELEEPTLAQVFGLEG